MLTLSSFSWILNRLFLFLFSAWRFNPKRKDQGKGMLEVPWPAVDLREWFALERSTFWSMTVHSFSEPLALVLLVSYHAGRKVPWVVTPAWSRRTLTIGWTGVLSLFLYSLGRPANWMKNESLSATCEWLPIGRGDSFFFQDAQSF